MKPITGTVVSSRPIPLAKAATALKKFLASDNGADHDTLAYVRRASTAFDELVEFHNDLKSRREGRRHVVDDVEEKVTKRNSKREEIQIVEREESGEKSHTKKDKKKRKNFDEEGTDFAKGVGDGDGDEEIEVHHQHREKKMKKKRKSAEEGGEVEEHQHHQHSKKKRKVREEV